MFDAEQARAETEVGREIAETIDNIERHELVVVNEGQRTWRATEIVGERFHDPSDERVRKRAVRLESTRATCGLVLVEYPERMEAEVHVLESSNEIEECFETVAVTSVERIDIHPPRVLAQTGGESYHRPDPRAFLRGELLPLCSYGNHKESASSGRFRLERPENVFPDDQPCIRCFREQKVKRVDSVACPDCGQELVDGVLHGPDPSQMEAIEIACPSGHCDFAGPVSLADA